jgi:hypothetical protein
MWRKHRKGNKKEAKKQIIRNKVLKANLHRQLSASTCIECRTESSLEEVGVKTAAAVLGGRRH